MYVRAKAPSIAKPTVACQYGHTCYAVALFIFCNLVPICDESIKFQKFESVKLSADVAVDHQRRPVGMIGQFIRQLKTFLFGNYLILPRHIVTRDCLLICA